MPEEFEGLARLERVLHYPGRAATALWIGEQNTLYGFSAMEVFKRIANGRISYSNVNSMIHVLAWPKNPLVERLDAVPPEPSLPYHRLENGLWAPLMEACEVVLNKNPDL